MNGADYVREALAIIELDVRAPCARPDAPSGSLLGAAGLAARIGFSVQHFSRLFRSLTGETPADYILKRRLTEAARRILVEPTSVVQIAREGGWSDYETFSRACKRHFGVSPSRAKANPDLSVRFRDPIDPASVVAPPPSPAGSADPAMKLSGPHLREHGPLHLVGLPFFMDRSVRSFHRPWAIFCQAFSADPERFPGRICPERFCQFSSWLEDEQARAFHPLCSGNRASRRCDLDPGALRLPLGSCFDVPRVHAFGRAFRLDRELPAHLRRGTGGSRA
ncbi:MAG: helix-turn-helix transcriptional regulator [Polyangiaceae bacterium]|nr:helix-turn-helix transcriptional regulator [Polyangiaceae bacterium]